MHAYLEISLLASLQVKVILVRQQMLCAVEQPLVASFSLPLFFVVDLQHHLYIYV
jgi:hypothetical protein